MQDIEFHGVFVNTEIRKRGHRVGIVTRAADQTEQLLAHFTDHEQLLARAVSQKAHPYARDLILCQLLPRTWRNVRTGLWSQILTYPMCPRSRRNIRQRAWASMDDPLDAERLHRPARSDTPAPVCSVARAAGALPYWLLRSSLRHALTAAQDV